MARIEIVNDGTVRECAEGANLLAELLRAGAFVDNPCNGTGVCGKCSGVSNNREQKIYG